MDDFHQLIDAANFPYSINYKYDADTGLNAQTIDYIANVMNDADWIREFRKIALTKFHEIPLPQWVTNCEVHNLDLSTIQYYLANDQLPQTSSEKVSQDVKTTFDRLGVPEKERKFLAGVEA
jgi:Fe-S cluster assembly protein SufB